MSGDYFLFLDADDVLPPNSISSRLKLFEQNPNLSFVDGQVEMWNHDFSQLLETKKHSFSGNPKNALLNLDESVFFGPSWMIKRKPGFEYRFKEGMTHGEDLLFYLSIADQGEYAAVDEVVYQYRKGREGSAMSNLKGLEKGYSTFIEEASKVEGVTPEQIRTLRSKTGKIMFKSYLAQGQFKNALHIAANKFKIS